MSNIDILIMVAGKLLADYLCTGARPLVLAEADPARCVEFIR